jgi:IS5 family transposase
MEAPIGADAGSGLVHTAGGTAAKVHDVVEANSLLHGKETMYMAMQDIKARTSARTRGQ